MKMTMIIVFENGCQVEVLSVFIVEMKTIIVA